MLKRIREASPRFKARIAGALYLLPLLTAVFTEFFVRGRLGFAADLAAGLIEVSGMIAVTLLFYDIFKPVNRSLSLLAAFFNLVGLTFELLQLNPRGVVIGIVFHGFYCLLIGYLIFRSTFLPRILGAPMAFAGLCWLTFLSPQLAKYLSPYNLASGLLGEAPLMLWLIVGVNVQRWKEQASAAGARA
jgi:heme A synthase